MELRTATLMNILLNFFLFLSQSCAQNLRRPGNFTDQQSLLAVKSYITSDPQRVLETWNSSISFCSWSGVSCNVTKQRVTGLDLKNLGLVGTIAPHIGNLSFLHSLNLAGNMFSSSIPQEIGNLFRLKTLNLSSNHLEGAIPASLGLCFELIILDLSSNNLAGRIPSELGQLSKLDVMKISDNFLTGSIPPTFRNLSSITNVILSSNSLTGSIPEGLGDLPLMVNIDLGLNQLEGEIPPSIFNKSSLINLGLTTNRISGTLPSDMFSKLTNLAFLYIGGNQFSGNLPMSLGNASNLIQADLSRNNFTGHIPLLWNLPNIQVLSFDTNQLVTDGDHGWDFLTSLANSTQLQVFSLASNLITGKLPSSVGNLSQLLSQFVIGGNHIEGSLPAEIGNLVGLSMLSVEFNSFSGNIPASIGNLPILQNLYLYENNFSGEIPKSLANLTALSEMALGRNCLSGNIPSNIGNLQHLQALDLSDNMLHGTIPVEIFSIPNLAKVLNLSFNSLSGYIPEQIGKLTMIQAIDLSSNHFTGAIPSSIGGCSSLEYLNLSRNSLRGLIPSAIGDMKGIEFIDLSPNNLSGEIPESLGTLQYLQFLDLSMNHLEGSIPTEGVFTNTTLVFLSGNPQLCGGIPEFNLPKCNLTNKKHARSSKARIITGLVVGLVASFTLLVAALIFLWQRKKQQQKALTSTPDDVSPDERKYKLYSYHDLKSATGEFSQQNLIGQGSFGSVYRAVFTDGTRGAVKVFNLELQEAFKSFMTECEALRNVRHRNLVKIVSVCSTGKFKALVLPFMTNGSLDQWIHKKSELHEESVGRLNLRQRLKIVREVASAVEYLHHDCETPIVHCDLKPNNVLLDGDMCAHVADFGIARILNASNNHPTSSTLGLKGSIGYIAPEYGLGGAVSTKGDVYSFGILVLEMFTGKRPIDEDFTGKMDLQGWVAKGLTSNIADILDHHLLKTELGPNDSTDGVFTVLQIGLRCASISPEARPTMRDVSLLINNITV